jgi:signal peptidase II
VAQDDDRSSTDDHTEADGVGVNDHVAFDGDVADGGVDAMGRLVVEPAAVSWRGPVLLALAIVVADQLTKHWAINRLSDDRVIEVIWTLQFNLAFNSGMAFSAGQGLGPIIAVLATVIIVWLLVSLRTSGGGLNTFGIGCVIGGAAGNLIDRAFRQEGWLRGSVVDFIDFQWFPIFNIADMAINIGAGALILNAFLSSRRPGTSS